MPLFSRFKSKGAQQAAKSKSAGDGGNGNLVQPKQTEWQSRWESTAIVPSEIMELVHVCTAEMKSRAEALDAPFLLLPFRPDSDAHPARAFVRSYYKSNAERSSQYRGEGLQQELRLTDSVVLCSILKWCWSRMPEGVVSWPVYESFRVGEQECNLARNAFDTFIPIGTDSEARKSIIFDFYDLLAAVAAHGKMNGLTGRKISRLAGWWAFEHSDDGKGFEGGYKSWTAAADASSHLFFAYLRSLSPDMEPSMNVIERIPRSLQALLASTEYPPETPSLLQRTTSCVVMLVDTVSPTPFALLRRAKNFEYRDRDRVLREFAEFEDPIDALTDECKRVLYAISCANQSTISRSRQGLTNPDESWNAFSSAGFADLDERALARKVPASMNGSTKTVGHGLREQPVSRSADAGRPTTPSWADFLSSGFADDEAKSPTLLYPPAHVLPPLGSRSSSPGRLEDENLAPGELAAITNIELDDAFWWVWMISLAGEEPASRKAVFGRCALIETTIMNGRWLIMEEQVKGASPDPVQGAYIAPKKSLFSFTKRGRLSRKRSATTKQQNTEPPERTLSATPSKTSISIDQHAKIRAAAQALTRKRETPETESIRRGRHDDASASKTNSMLTIGLQSEAGPAMKWASSYDKNTIRAQYLGDSFAGKGRSREDLRRVSSTNVATEGNSNVPAVMPTSPAVSTSHAEPSDRDLPPVPQAAPVMPTSPHAIEPKHFEAEQSPESNVPTLDADVAHEHAGNAPALELARPDANRALDKELAVEPSPPTTPNKIGRKPVQRPQDHPALRPQDKTSPAPATNPAAIAAARAMFSNTSPETQKDSNKLKKQAGSGGGFKKLFGKKKDHAETSRPGNNGLAPPNDNGLGRRLSLMRKKNGQTASPRNSESAVNGRPEVERAAQEPVVSAFQMDHDHSPVAKSRSSIGEREAAEREFSRFDQGPIEDMPSQVPMDSGDDLTPEVDQHKFDTPAAKSLPPQAAKPVEQAPFDAPVSDNESEVTMDDHRNAQAVQDRWATIRENAQKRATQQRGSEEQDAQSRPSQSQRTDDGETSGEETIESRVARIKARVAELTGNMERT